MVEITVKIFRGHNFFKLLRPPDTLKTLKRRLDVFEKPERNKEFFVRP